MSNSHAKRLLRNSGLTVLGRGCKAGEQLVRSVLIARSLGVETYATYALILAFVTTSAELLNTNLGTALVKLGADFREHEQPTSFHALVRLCLGISAASIVASLLLVSLLLLLLYDVFIPTPGLGLESFLVTLSVTFGFLGTPTRAVLILLQRFRAYALIDVSVSVVALAIFSAAALLYPGSLRAMLLALALTTLCQELGSGLYVLIGERRELGPWWRAPLAPLRPHRRAFLELLIGNSLSLTAQRLTRRADVLILGALCPPAAVSVYDVAKKLTTGLALIKDSLTLSVFPQIAQLVASGARSQLRRLLGQVTLIALGIALPFLAVVGVFGELAITTIFGRDFVGGGAVLAVLCGGLLTSVVLFWTSPYVICIGQIRKQVVAVGMGGLVSVALGVALATPFDTLGVAVASLIGTILTHLFLATVALTHMYANATPAVT